MNGIQGKGIVITGAFSGMAEATIAVAALEAADGSGSARQRITAAVISASRAAA